MKKIFYFLLFAAISVQTARASGDSLLVGHCVGRISDECKVFNGDAGHVSAATIIPAETMRHYQGNRLTALRFAVVSKLKIDSINVWVREKSTDNNIADVMLKKSQFDKGWNQVSLPKAIDIEDKDYVLGMTYYQSATGYVISTVSKDTEGGLLTQIDDGEWQDRSHEGLGVLSMEGVVTGNSLLQHDVCIAETEISNDSIKLGNTITLSAIIRNNGLQPISSVYAKVSPEGMEPFYRTIQLDRTISYRDSASVEIDFKPEHEGTGLTSDVEIVGVDNYEDEWTDNGYHTYIYTVKEHLFMKKMLMEYFTGESCGNCPRVGGFVDRLIDEHPQKSRIISIEHHTYGTDPFSVSDSRSYASMFEVDGAPWLLYDRNPQNLICPGWTEEDMVWNLTDLTLSEPTTVYVHPEAQISKDSTNVYVTVDCEINEQFSLDNPRLTVFLVEDKMPAVLQYFYDDRIGEKFYFKGDEYIHRNVLRATDSKWGEPITFKDNATKYECSFTLTEDMKKNFKNLYIVAFVGNYDENDNQNCKVENIDRFELRKASINEEGTDISLNHTEGSIRTVYYNVSGQRIAEPQKGLNIAVSTDSKGNIVNVHKFIK